MSGSKKGRKLRPYRTCGVTPVYVHLMTDEEMASDAWEYGPTTAEMLEWAVDVPAEDGDLVAPPKSAAPSVSQEPQK